MKRSERASETLDITHPTKVKNCEIGRRRRNIKSYHVTLEMSMMWVDKQRKKNLFFYKQQQFFSIECARRNKYDMSMCLRSKNNY